MPDALRPFLVALVLLNLGFVQLTDALDGAWMAGLWLLAASSPLFVRWQDRLWYRGLWNGGVVVAFALLLQHALTTGLLHMLEDGLLLAAFCQVHLLNNVGRRQRPDLLFFNSFLIAYVTSFFSHDLGWSLCFFAYAALLVPSLQLFALLPREHGPAAGVVRAIVRDSLPRSGLALLGTVALFVLWPRDFRHEGWLGDTLQFASPQLVAFAEEIRLDRANAPLLSDAPVLRIRPAAGQRDRVPAHWRGATFVQFDGSGWQPGRADDFGARFPTDLPWQAQSRTTWRRAPATPGAPLELRLLDPTGGRLFLPLEAAELTLTAPDAPLLAPQADATLGFDPATPAPAGLRGTARLAADPRARPNPPSRALWRLRQLPGELPRPLRELAAALRAELPADAGARTIAEHCRDWLQGHRRYALPGSTGAARNLAEFLLGTGGGHCEYFATTLALLLRLHDIPCRVVGGYLAHEWDEARGEFVVRQRDAHAWVEALLPDRGWTTLDATPAAADRGAAATSWWPAFVAAVGDLWRAVTGFDEGHRRRLFAWFGGLPGALAAALSAEPAAALALLALAIVWRWQRRRRRGPPPTVRRWLTALRAAGLAPLPGETPRELLARARRLPLRAARLGRLEAELRAHERARYARPQAARAD